MHKAEERTIVDREDKMLWLILICVVPSNTHTHTHWTRRYHLLAIDHDLLSFTDTRLDQWPLVLITNPKDAHFIVPSREPTKRMVHSTHIRFLAFSPDTITTVTAWVDGERLTTPTHSGGGALYTVPWQPEKYAAGLHTIRVYVKVPTVIQILKVGL